jgi:hypothetical protein
MTTDNPETTKGSTAGALCVFEPLVNDTNRAFASRLHHSSKVHFKRTRRDGRQP